MIRFNVIGTGFVDMAEGSGLQFKAENQWFRFCDISLSRSVEFSIPATDRNRRLLEFGEDPAETGMMLRQSLPCQMVYDGGVVNGTLNVTAYEGNAFKCVFFIGNAEWINKLQNLKLSDCVLSYDNGVVWDTGETVYDADVAHGMILREGLVKYDDDGISPSPYWQLVPSVSLSMYLQDILTNLGVSYLLNIPHKYRIITGSMKGGTQATVTIASTSTAVGSVTAGNPFLEAVVSDIYRLKSRFGNIILAEETTPCVFFRAKTNCTVTFPADFPATAYCPFHSDNSWYTAAVGDYYWGARMVRKYGKQYDSLGGYSYYGEALAGRTIELKRGQMFFVTDQQGADFGFDASAAPFSYNLVCEATGTMSLGETWFMKYNHPDMTVFEFCKSVALALGHELTVDADEGIKIGQGFAYPVPKELKNVISIDTVRRNVDTWGSDTQTAKVAFDSEKYVNAPIVTVYPVNTQLSGGEKVYKSGFSEGSLGDNGILVNNVKQSGVNTYEFQEGKFTICETTPDSTYMQRVDPPQITTYMSLAAESTCVHCKCLMTEAEFFGTKPYDTFMWRGSMFVWMSADWSDGVASMTLQKLPQPYELNPQPKYLTFTADEAWSTIQLTKKGVNGGSLDAVIEKSLDDGETWTAYNFYGNDGETIALANVGVTVMFRGENVDFSTDKTAYYNFVMTGKIAASGDVTTLLNHYGGDVPLPSYCFYGLFDGCASLSSAPSLPSRTVSSATYSCTFQGCSGLTSMPELPALTMGGSSYSFMFKDCTGLTEAVLPATTLASGCYRSIFEGASALAYVELYGVVNVNSSALQDWLKDAAASGTLKCDQSVTLNSGNSGLPTGWARVNL